MTTTDTYKRQLSLKRRQIKHKKGLLVTPAYVHWLADVHSGGFAPAFTLSFHDSECSRKPPNAHNLGRYLQA